MAKTFPVPFKQALPEYIELYLSSRLTYSDISAILGKGRGWLSDYIRGDRGIPAATLQKLYVILPEIVEDIEDGVIEHPVVRERGRPRARPRLTVTISGPRQSGKTTVASLIAEAMERSGVEVSVDDGSDPRFSLEDVMANLPDMDVRVSVRTVAAK